MDQADPEQVLVFRLVDGWVPLKTSIMEETDDAVRFEAQLPGFSQFALAVDQQAPTLDALQPETESVLEDDEVTLSTGFEDNRGIDEGSFRLTVNGIEVPNDHVDLTLTPDGFSFPPGALATGDVTVEATIADTSGLTTTETWSFTHHEPEPLEELGDDTDTEDEETLEETSASEDTSRPAWAWLLLVVLGLAAAWWRLRE